MQESFEEKYPTRSVFCGTDGAPASATVKCFNETIDSWSALLRRLNYFGEDLGKAVYPHAICSESKVEHSFGSVKKSGQGHLLNLQEYVQAKRSTQIDFQLRMCDVPFSQEIKSKLRDKGYHDEQEKSKLKLSLRQLKEIFRNADVNNEDIPATDLQKNTLKKANLLTKCVPRNALRSRYRETGNFHPDLMIKDVHGKLFKGDLVFFRNVENSLDHFVVTKDRNLSDSKSKLSVERPGQKGKIEVNLEQLVTDKGHILAIPKKMYAVKNGGVVFDDAVDHLLEGLLSNPLETCDDDNDSPMEDVVRVPPVDITDFAVETAIINKASTSGKRISSDKMDDQNASDSEILIRKSKKKRVKNIIASDDEDENEFPPDKPLCVDELLPGDWVVSKFQVSRGRDKFSINYYVGQILPNAVEEEEPRSDEVKVQYYRSKVPNEQIYVMLENWEFAKKDTIIEQIEKPDILSGGRIRLLSTPKSGKLV